MGTGDKKLGPEEPMNNPYGQVTIDFERQLIGIELEGVIYLLTPSSAATVAHLLTQACRKLKLGEE